jgi:hypothetical protein
LDDLCLSCMEIWGIYQSNITATPTKHGSPHHWQISKQHTKSW